MQTIKKEEAIELLESIDTDTDMIYKILKLFENDQDIESSVAMALSLRTSVYDREKGAHVHMYEMLEILSKSENMQARWAVAKNPHTPEGVLVKLSKDNVNLVRALVANNPKTPQNILIDLFNDEKIVRDGLTGNPKTPQKILKLFINENDRMARLRVAENIGCSKEVLELLLKDNDNGVRVVAQRRLKELDAKK